jgi:hypothetical protein
MATKKTGEMSEEKMDELLDALPKMFQHLTPQQVWEKALAEVPDANQVIIWLGNRSGKHNLSTMAFPETMSLVGARLLKEAAE